MSRFAPFTRIDLPYRFIGSTPLEATLLIPTTLLPSLADKRHPVMVHWHGGGFIVGHRMYEPWFAQWLLDLALSRNAIIVTPDYRLLPESNGLEILSDVAHFWTWLQSDLPFLVESRNLPRLDLSRVLCCGESSGGFMSVYSALHLSSLLSHGRADPGPAATCITPGENLAKDRKLQIKAVISVSAPLDASDPEYKIPRPRIINGTRPPPPKKAISKIRNYINSIPTGTIRTGSEPTADMWELLLCVAQQAYLPRLFGAADGEKQGALESIVETLKLDTKTMAPLWIIHGLDDTLCPPVCSTGFARRLNEAQPDVPVHLDLLPGEHMFDVNLNLTMKWAKEGVDFVNKFWP